jgi:2-methylaconitate cis-trans-isomerase PrpF
MKTIPVAIYRGGTSRAIFFHEKDLPKDISEQDRIILQAIGSGHSLQVNGLGGGNPLTSKCAIIGPPSVPQADVNYTFVYPGVTQKIADRKGNCGNISSAVGPFAVNEGLVAATGDQTSVVIYNINTQALLRATFEIRNGRFYPKGDYAIDGAPDTGSRISLEFLSNPELPLLPTGQVRETLDVTGVSSELEVTIVQAGNLAVFCSMAALAIKGDPAGWEKDAGLWQKMEAVRGAAAVRLGMAETLEEARLKTPAVPKILAVRKPQPYMDLSGRPHAKESHDFMVLTAAMGVMHRSLAVTGSVATAAAAVLPGSVVYDLRRGMGSEVVIGHPSGQIALTAELDEKDGKWQARKIALNRTAREIMKGFVFIED